MIQTEPSLPNLIHKIRQAYERDHENEFTLLRPMDNLLSQVSDNLYSTEFHFILELIQNAVDSSRQVNGTAQPVQVSFHLRDKDRTLVVANNGAPFSEIDVKRICGQGEQRKGPRKIGYKGIGFKSVVRITHNPQVYSPGCYFQFNQSFYPDYPYAWLIIPHEIPGDDVPTFVKPDWVTFALPFHENVTSEEIARLSQELDDPSPELLLFLENLAQLEIKDDYSQRVLHLRKRPDPTGFTVVERNSTDTEAAWKVVGRWITTSHHPQRPLPPEALNDYETRRGLKARKDQEEIDITDTRIALAFAVDEKGNFVDQEGLLYAFFPIIRQKSGLRFAIQADFLTTAGRETLANPSPWNTWLLSNLPEAIEATVETLKQRLEWHSIIYEALPLEGEGEALEGQKESPFKAVVRELLTHLRQAPVVATDLPGDEAWILPEEAVWLTPSLRSLLTNEDLPQLQSDKKAFVSFEIKSKRAREFLSSSKGLGVAEIGDQELLGFLQNTDWIQYKSPGWFAHLFNHLATVKLNEKQPAMLQSLKLVPTLEGLVQADEGVFLPPTEGDPLQATGTKFVHPEVLANLDEEGASFLVDILQVEPATYLGIIDKVILPTLKQKKDELSALVLTEYVAFVRSYYECSTEEIRPRPLQNKLRQLLLQAADGSWQPASQLCLPYDKQGGQTLAGYLLEGASSKFFVKLPAEDDWTQWLDFYQWLGVNTDPPLLRLQEALSDISWFANKPAVWFTTLYTYLEPHVDKAEFNRTLKLIPVEQVDGTLQLYPTSPQLYFQTEDSELKGLEEIFAGDNISFVYTAVLLLTESLPFPADPVRARHFLEKLGITELKPDDIIRRLIIKQFEIAVATEEYSPRLIGYILFAFKAFSDRKNLETSSVWREFKAAVRLQATDGSWLHPADLYLTKAYGTHDFESLLKDFRNVYFLSDIYLTRLKLPKEHLEQLRQFVIGLGVRDRLIMTISDSWLNAWDYFHHKIDWSTSYRTYFNQIMEQDRGEVLRFYVRHRIRYHPEIEWLKRILDTQSPARLRILLNILADFWESEKGYRKYATVKYEYDWYGAWRSSEDKPSFPAWLLRTKPILPTNQGFKGHKDWVFRDTPEIRQLVGNQRAYLNFTPKQNQRAFLAEFLGVVWNTDTIPPWIVVDNIRQLKKTNTATVEQCAVIYQFLVKKDYIAVLEEEELIFLPTPSRSWWKPSELFWVDFSKEFGSLRGYISLEPAYRDLFSTFEKVGVNTKQPQPKDWADLLLDIEQTDDEAKQIIWRAYRNLEEFWRENPDEPPAWWDDFINRVQLLTESGNYVSITDGIYLPDDNNRYQYLKGHLPFIWLPDSYRLVKTLLEKMGLRRISDPRWVKAEIQPGQVVDAETASEIQTKILAHRIFIRSLLIHKHPTRADEFEPLLSLLDGSSVLKVSLVDGLQVQLQATAHPDVTIPARGQQDIYYAPSHHTLYILASKSKDPKVIGRGAAAIFEGFEDDLRSDLMLLFGESSLATKKQLLEHDLGIQLCEPMLVDEEKIKHGPKEEDKPEGAKEEPTEKKAEPTQDEEDLPGDIPEEIEEEIEEIEFIPTPRQKVPPGPRYRRKSTPRSKQPPKKRETGEEDQRKKIGIEGERIALDYLKNKLINDYPMAEIEEAADYFALWLDDTPVVEVDWLEEEEGNMVGYDIHMVEYGVEKYYEVKSTNSEAKALFPISRAQWAWAKEQGNNYYILRVYNVGATPVKIQKIRNPYNLWEKDMLAVYPLQIEL